MYRHSHRQPARSLDGWSTGDARFLRVIRVVALCSLLLCIVAMLLGGVGIHRALAQDTADLAEEIEAVRSLPPTWTDSFRSDDGMWEVDDESESSSLIYFASNYRIGVVEPQIYAWGLADYEAANVLVEVDGYSIDGNANNEFGIVLRHEDIGNFYTFLVSNDGTYTVRRLEGDVWVDMVPWGTSDLIDQTEGAVNRVGAYANGSTLALLINGEIVATIEDETFSSGAIGLAAGSFDAGGIEIGFDDLAVWDLDNLSEAAPISEIEATLAPPVEETAEATLEPTEEATQETPEGITPEPIEEPTVEPLETPTPAAIDILNRLDQIRNNETTYTDEFRRDEGAWRLPNDDATETEIVGRELSVHIIDPNWMGWALLNENPSTEFLVEVDVTQTEGAPNGMLGVLFHFIDDANFDFFAVSSDGHWTFWRLEGNQWEQVQGWTPTDALATGLDETNRLGVLVQDGIVTLLINDEAVAEFDDDTSEPGNVALGVGTLAEGEITVLFDNLDLWSLDSGTGQDSLEPTTEASPEATVVESTEEATPEPAEEVTEEATVEATAEATEEATEEPTAETTAAPTTEATEEAVVEETPEPPVEGGEDVSAQVAAPEAETPAFTSEFRRDDGEWSLEVDEDVDHYYQSRQLHLFIDRENWLTISNSASASAANFLAEVEATQTAGPEVNEFGLAFRVVDADNFYAYFVSGNGYWNLSKFEEGDWITLSDWMASDAIAGLGEVNRLGVLADGEVITLFVNGEQVGQVTDGSFSEGGIALLAGTFDDPGVDVAFDNFALWEIAE